MYEMEHIYIQLRSTPITNSSIYSQFVGSNPEQYNNLIVGSIDLISDLTMLKYMMEGVVDYFYLTEINFYLLWLQ